ncbi:MAG: ATP-binding protein [Alphaproteobacteria bacterium]|nr:ATP-binding protein [Alphaproteobacteria bacterium]
MNTHQLDLARALRPIRRALLTHLQRAGHPVKLPPPDDPEPSERRTALDELCAALELCDDARRLLLLVLGCDVDPDIARMCALAHGIPGLHRVTVGLAMTVFPDTPWSVVSPEAPLRRWHVLRMESPDDLIRSLLRLDEQLLNRLMGVDHLNAELAPLLRLVAPAWRLPESHAAQAAQLQALWASSPPPLIQLQGPGPEDVLGLAAWCAEAEGGTLCRLDAWKLPAELDAAERIGALLAREARLRGVRVLLDLEDCDESTVRRALELIEPLDAPWLLSRVEPLRQRVRPIVRFEVGRPTSGEQRVLWREALEGSALAVGPSAIDAMVTQFNLSAGAIRTVALAAAGASAHEPPAARLWDRCRVQSRTRLDGLARRIETTADWDDLVLPPDVVRTLEQIRAQVRERGLVYERWGYGQRLGRGRGITALFAGSSGTGKTLAAEVLANALRLDLVQVDLSSVVSKYIGETEKNLRRVFDAAEAGGVVLLFDEADALFGKRGEVKDSHDRYANIEVSYLLQRMERYTGLAILTTNLKKAIDNAFLRRLRFVVDFPFPSLEQRARIWEGVFPPGVPVAGLDPVRLARLNVPGGNIRNIALHAAFLAAERATPVTMPLLAQAARDEFLKIGRTLSDGELW